MTTRPQQLDYSTRGFLVDATAAFAGVLLIVTAMFDVLQGLAAIADPELFAAGSTYLYEFNVAAWGWVHLIIGILTIAVGVAILVGVAWGWILGMVFAGLGALTNFLYLPHYPWWSATIIALNVLIFWALSNKLRTAP